MLCLYPPLILARQKSTFSHPPPRSTTIRPASLCSTPLHWTRLLPGTTPLLLLPLQILPCLCLCQPPSIPFHPLEALCGTRVPPVQRPPGDLHVTPGAPWVGEVSFLQNHHIVEDIPVHKVHPHCRPCRHSHRAPLHGVFLRSPLCRKVHPVNMGPPPRCRCGPLLPSPRRPPMLSHQMNRQGSDRQHLPALSASHLVLEYLPVGLSYSRDLPPICLRS